jgi:hypothetical protein
VVPSSQSFLTTFAVDERSGIISCFFLAFFAPDVPPVVILWNVRDCNSALAAFFLYIKDILDELFPVEKRHLNTDNV